MSERTAAPVPLVNRLTAAWNSHDVDQVMALFAAGFEGVDVAAPAPQHGLPDLRDSIVRYLAAFPGLRVEVDDTIVQGDRVVLAWTALGKHQGPLMNIPATGRDVAVRGVSLLTLADGMVVRSMHVWDVAGLLRSIGLLPEL